MKENKIYKLSKKTILSLVFFIFFVNACVTPMGMTASSTPLQEKIIEENRGKAEGSDSVYSLLFFIPLGYPDIDKAIENAVKSKEGDALINLRWYEKKYEFLIFGKTSIVVTGDVVKFSDKK
ncbi:MAG: hypothetical protein OEZ13_01025 [Spirochaetia bacterium]|nr:hypothetical protein [Spirochaetia bacterium]